MRGFLLLALLPLLVIQWPVLRQEVLGRMRYDPSSLKDKRVVVCGASTGIGEEIAYEYARLGAHVAVIARREDALKKVAQKCSELGAASVVVVPADLSTEKGNANALQAVLKAPAFDNKIDVLVLNHVLGQWGWWLPESYPQQEYVGGVLGAPNTEKGYTFGFNRKMFEVNIVSYIELATMAMPYLVRSGQHQSANGGGQIIVVGSTMGKMGGPKIVPYSATKHAAHGFADSLRIELMYKKMPVSVTLCIIGAIDTANKAEITAGDLVNAPNARVDETAAVIVRSGATREREMYYPFQQGIHLLVMIRPFMMDLVDQLLMAVAV